MKRTNVLQALIFSIVILFGGTACDNANDERFSSTEEFTVEGDASSIEIPMTRTNWIVASVMYPDGGIMTDENGYPLKLEGMGTVRFHWGSITRDQIGDWNYNVGANLTTIKNKVLSLVQDGYSIIAGDKSQSYTMAGYPIGYFYGYKVEGVYQTQEEINNSPKNTLATVTPGDLKFKDVNGDGEITTADRTMIGDPTPNVTYGITLGVGYKNWELAVDMMGQGGNQIYRTWDNYSWSQFNFMAQRMDRWHGEGTSNTQPLLNTKHTINNMNSEYYIEDGSFFRIRNVSLAYNFDKALISKIGMQALKLYVNIQNLKTWKHNTGYTPELGGSAIAFGVDDGSYPMPAIYTFGFNLTF